jgi:hypothetical protein
VISSLDAAYGPGATVEVYTSQKNHVAERVLAGERHIQPWAKSAAYDSPFGRGWRVAHKRGYLWMSREYAARMGRPLIAAPVWVGFDLGWMLRLRSPAFYPKRRETERVLALRVPRSELLLSDYDGWSNFVLEGICLDHDASARDITPGARCGCTARRRHESWRGIFKLAADPLEWQGVLDRIEPAWEAKLID